MCANKEKKTKHCYFGWIFNFFFSFWNVERQQKKLFIILHDFLFSSSLLVIRGTFLVALTNDKLSRTFDLSYKRTMYQKQKKNILLYCCSIYCMSNVRHWLLGIFFYELLLKLCKFFFAFALRSQRIIQQNIMPNRTSQLIISACFFFYPPLCSLHVSASQ